MNILKPQNGSAPIPRGNRFKDEVISFVWVIAVIILAQLIVLGRGYMSASADEFSRILLAASWADTPYFIKPYVIDPTNAWQPWHFYLLGIVIKMFPQDIFLTSRIVTMLFSYSSLIFLYLLGRKLFNRWVGLLAVLMVGMMRTHVNLSLTPMVDIIFITFLTAFLYYFILWHEAQYDKYLIYSALMVSCASGLRYDGWFAAAAFASVMAIMFINRVRSSKKVQWVFLLSAGIACVPVLVWLGSNYRYLGDPLFFLSRHHGSGRIIYDIGPLTLFSRNLAIIEVMLLNWVYIVVLAVLGMFLSYHYLGRKLWLYVFLGFTPLLILAIKGGIGRAYRPHYPFPFLFLLMPFCAYFLYSFINLSEKIFGHLKNEKPTRLLILISVFNLWLIYLRIFHHHSIIVIGGLILGSILLSLLTLDRKTWYLIVVGLTPLMFLILNTKLGLLPKNSLLLGSIVLLISALYYFGLIWKMTDDMSTISIQKWRMAGIGMLVIICFFNLYESIFRIPKGMPDSAIRTGLVVRGLYADGTLAKTDNVLVEVSNKDYKGIQVMSNHPKNFVLDRAAYGSDSRKSFLLDEAHFPHKVGALYTDYIPQKIPFKLDSDKALQRYFDTNGIRLIIVKDPTLDEFVAQHTQFKKIKRVEAYQIYLADKSGRP